MRERVDENYASYYIDNIDLSIRPTETDSSLALRFHSSLDSHKFHLIVLVDVSTIDRKK